MTVHDEPALPFGGVVDRYDDVMAGFITVK
jgi:hypothetical protein